MRPFVWDEWPEYFLGRLRVLYELRGEVRYRPRPPLPWNWTRRRALLCWRTLLLLLHLAGLRKLLQEVRLEVAHHRLHLLHAVTKSREGDELA